MSRFRAFENDTVADSTILVADDTRATARALAELLTRAGHSVEVAIDGTEALRRACEPRIDLVVLDLALPELDGLQVLRLLRARENRRHLPVIVLTVSEDPTARLTALQLGADDVLTKPWNTEVLLARIRRCLEWKAAVDRVPATGAMTTAAAAAANEAAAIATAASLHDPITGLLTDRGFQDRLQDEFRRATRYADPLALVLLSLEVQSPSGSPVPPSHALLREVSEALRGAVRDTDLLAHTGPRAFAALLPKTSLAGGLSAAERMLSRVRGARGAGAEPTRLSLGVAGYPHRSLASPEAVFRAAAQALEEARAEKTDRIRLFAQALSRQELDRRSPPSPGRF